MKQYNGGLLEASIGIGAFNSLILWCFICNIISNSKFSAIRASGSTFETRGLAILQSLESTIQQP